MAVTTSWSTTRNTADRLAKTHQCPKKAKNLFYLFLPWAFCLDFSPAKLCLDAGVTWKEHFKHCQYKLIEESTQASLFIHPPQRCCLGTSTWWYKLLYFVTLSGENISLSLTFHHVCPLFSAYKPQVWKSWFLWEAGEAGRGIIRHGLQRKEQVSFVRQSANIHNNTT